MIPIGEALHDFRRGFLARKIEEEFLDVLDLERPLLKGVLLQLIFHRTTDYSRAPRRLPADVHSVRKATIGSTRVARRAGQ